MGVSYDAVGSELVTESEKGLWKAGKRCPELFLKRHGDEQTITLHSMLDYGKFLILSIEGEVQYDHKAHTRKNTSHFTILPSASTVEGSKDGVFTSEVVLPDEEFVVVVRPDMYIGYVGQDNGWQDYLAEVFLH